MISLFARNIVLRPLEEGDLDMLWEMSKLPQIVNFMEWEPPESREEFDQLPTKERNLFCRKEAYCFVITDRSGAFVGRCVLRKKSLGWFVGFFIHPDMQRKGYATEAVRRLAVFAKEFVGIPRIFAHVLPHNTRSIRVLENAGMQYAGIAEEKFAKTGETLHLYVKNPPSSLLEDC